MLYYEHENARSKAGDNLLVVEDFPGKDHFIAEDEESIPAPNHADGHILHEPLYADGHYVENITGYFSLYKARAITR